MTHPMYYRTPFWKLALGGVIAGALLYFFPFLIPALAFILLAGFLFRLFFSHARWGGHHWHMRQAYAEHWHSMTDEQRAEIRGRYAGHGCCGWAHQRTAPPSSTPNT